MTKVLIVDDKAEERYLLETLLKGTGYEVVSAQNGKEALKKLWAEGADIVVSDILMPVMDGFKLCREVKSNEKVRGIPFIFYTATYTDSKDEEFAMSLGAERFIRKPMEPEAFIGMLREVIGQHKAGQLEVRRKAVAEEKVYLKLYNEALIRKLEDKVEQLEEAYKALKQEIIERKRAEEELNAERFKLRVLFENLPIIVYNVSLDGKILDCNPMAIKTMEYESKGELIGKTLVDTVYAPSSRRKASQLFEKWKKEGKLKNEEMQIITGQGKILDVLLNVDTIYDLKGNSLYSISTQVDITERKRIEEALRKSEERYRELFENVPVGIYRTTPEGEIIDANPAMVQMLGYPDRESLIMAKAEETYVNPEERRKWQEMMEREGEVRSYEKQLRRRDGSVIWVQEDSRAARDASGRVIYYEGAMVDITERKRSEEEKASLQEQFRQSQKIEAIGRLSGGIAHDFNNILTIISGNAQLSLLDLKQGDPLRGNIGFSERISIW